MRFLLALACATSALAVEFPAPFNTEPAPGGPMPPDQAAASVRTPPGFHVTMFAAEPDVQQPIAIATDSRGRLWVAECYTYAESKVNYDTKLRDRIVIFEDADNDGHFDKRTVFWDQGQRLTSVELGFGGVWVTCAPNLLFIPDKNGDDIPDGPPEVVLDGWDTGPVRHNIVNGLRWGPDGWLYGRHGILATSLVGAPGTPAAQRTKINAGIWRYHPTRKIFEAVATGTTNPWGMDWNEVGEAFFTNTVIGHLWHLIPGAHYERMYGEDFNPHVYQFMGMCADHYHFDTGAGWTKSRATFDGAPASTSDTLGGGHAHCGCLIYQGDQWPEYWRGKVLTINFHGRRLNVDRLERSGSGYVAKHEPDAFFFGDPWFRGIDLIQSADGGVFVADWSDASECHDNDGVHRTSGRIYKITYGDGKRVAGNLGSTLGSPGIPPERISQDIAAFTDVEINQAQLSSNSWLARTARRVLQERAASEPVRKLASGEPSTNPDQNVSDRLFAQRESLRRSFDTTRDAAQKLRLLWALHATGADDQQRLKRSLSDSNEAVRAWALRFLSGQGADSILAAIAANETSARVRLALAVELPKLKPGIADQLASALLTHEEDATDPNVSLMLWYSIERSTANRLLKLSQFAIESRLPTVRRMIARRLAVETSRNSAPLAELFSAVPAGAPPELLGDVVSGMTAGLRGQRKAEPPAGWDGFNAKVAKLGSAEARVAARDLGVIFGDGRALDEVRAVALDAKAEIPTRRQALQSLIDARPPDLRTICEQLLDVRDLAGTAARGLAIFDDPKIGKLLVQKYGSLYPAMRPDVLGTLVARPVWAAMLLDAIANGQIARTDLGAFHARQIRSFNNEALTMRLAEVWGEVRETDDAKKVLIAKLKNQLTPDILAKADLPAGRALFAQTCAVCHKLYGEGGVFGPDLTGSARDNLTYLVENIADPSAIVPVDFRMSIVTLKDGRVLTGFVGAKTERAFTLRGLTDTQTIERAGMKEITDSPQSLMPEGLLSPLNETQVRDLIGYLMAKSQVPLPAAK
jgi:putative membrane-bound dehydrogenase-like protein